MNNIPPLDNVDELQQLIKLQHPQRANILIFTLSCKKSFKNKQTKTSLLLVAETNFPQRKVFGEGIRTTRNKVNIVRKTKINAGRA